MATLGDWIAMFERAAKSRGVEITEATLELRYPHGLASCTVKAGTPLLFIESILDDCADTAIPGPQC